MYRDQGKYAAAEPMYRRALAIREKALGPDNPELVPSLDNLAWTCYAQRKFAEAEPLYGRSLLIWEKAVGTEHPTVATALDNLAGVFVARERFANAEPLYQRALLIREKALLANYDKLASAYVGDKKYAQAEQLYQRALSIAERSAVPDRLQTGMVLERYAELLKLLNRKEEAARMFARVRQIKEHLAEDTPPQASEPAIPR
jgi:tetratricopeptide (TPR) repeat protein